MKAKYAVRVRKSRAGQGRAANRAYLTPGVQVNFWVQPRLQLQEIELLHAIVARYDDSVQITLQLKGVSLQSIATMADILSVGKRMSQLAFFEHVKVVFL